MEAEGLKYGGSSFAESWQSLIGWALCRQEEEVFLLPAGLCCHVWELSLLASQLYLNGSFSLVIFYTSPLWLRSFSGSITDPESDFFQFQQIFANPRLPPPPTPTPLCQERLLLGIVSHVRVKAQSLERYWSPIRITSRGQRENSQVLFL